MQRSRWSHRLLSGGSEPDPRFTLANERTFLAWIRTALALAAGGLAVVHLMPDLWGREPLGISLMGLSLITAVSSYRRWVLLETAIRGGSTLPASRMPAVLAIANRTLEKAQLLQQRFANEGNITVGHYRDFSGKYFDLVINATSASLHDELPPLPAGVFGNTSLAYDMLYSSRLTPFLEFAGTQGAAQLADGAGMLVEQAAESFLLWHGIRPETRAVIKRLRDELCHAS